MSSEAQNATGVDDVVGLVRRAVEQDAHGRDCMARGCHEPIEIVFPEKCNCWMRDAVILLTDAGAS